ncbi:MAG: LptF/LptG family permease, partial [Sphingopyxis sp.]
MNLTGFFPSRTLGWYVAKTFLLRSLAVLAMLVLVLQTLDLLGESGKIMAVAGNSNDDVWRYVGLRLPQIIARFLPFSVLLGTLITLVTLNQNSEIISMKSGGMSAHQILAPLIVASLFVALGSFLFNERIVTRSNATLSAWQKVEYARVPPNSGTRAAGDALLQS